MAKKSVIQAAHRRSVRLASGLMDEVIALRGILAAQGIEIPAIVLDNEPNVVNSLYQAEQKIMELEDAKIGPASNIQEARRILGADDGEPLIIAAEKMVELANVYAELYQNMLERVAHADIQVVEAPSKVDRELELRKRKNELVERLNRWEDEGGELNEE
jgi:hypothetical protein